MAPAPTDIRLLNLSYSGLLDLHSCPRRFQLNKLQAVVDDTDFESSITFSYGHIVGLGVQLVLEGKSEEEIFWQCFLTWEPDLFAENPRQNKSFWAGMAAIQQFANMREFGFLEEWELVYYQGKPACELSFSIQLPNQYKYRGQVDAVLQNKQTGEVMVLECKTSSATNLNPAQYKNSAQAVGYSVVLDSLFPALSSYEVLYLVYTTKNQVWTSLPFQKSYLQRALWLNELLLDCEVISLYESAGVYPMRGESCFDYYRECKYLQTCTLNTAYLTAPLSAEVEQKLLETESSKWQIVVSVEDLIRSQLAKEVQVPQVPQAPLTPTGDMML